MRLPKHQHCPRAAKKYGSSPVRAVYYRYKGTWRVIGYLCLACQSYYRNPFFPRGDPPELTPLNTGRTFLI